MLGVNETIFVIGDDFAHAWLWRHAACTVYSS